MSHADVNDPSTPQLQEGVPPSGSSMRGAVTVNGVRREAGRALLDVTMQTTDKANTFYHTGLKVTSNTGVSSSLGFAATSREIPAGSQAAAQLAVPVDDAASRLKMDFVEFGELEVPLPPAGQTFAWAPAPVRQTGVELTTKRDAQSALHINSLSTQGNVTEVSYHLDSYDSTLAFCRGTLTNPCYLVEPDGTKHGMIGEGPSADRGMRADGVLRFAGQINPASTELQLMTPRGWSDRAEPLKVPLPDHAGSPVRAVAGTLARDVPDFKPFTLTDPHNGVRVTVDQLTILPDRIQAHITAVGGTMDAYLDGVTQYLSVVEPNGFKHWPTAPSDVRLSVPRGEKRDATLAFVGPVPADVTQLEFRLVYSPNDQPVTQKVTIPAADAKPPAQATFSQVEGGAPAARTAPSLNFAPLPSPTSGPTDSSASSAKDDNTLVKLDIKPAQGSSVALSGRVTSVITGSTAGGSVASGATVDATADAAAQKSLKELGAQRTSEGYVLTLPETVLFDYNADSIKPDAAATLDKVAKLLSYYDKVKVGVNGHTDSSGEAAYNLDLSKRRAQAVAAALTGKGIAASRMAVTGYGLTKPVAPNADDAGKAKNRRVEIVLREDA